jgi:hypothetical protein
MPAKDIYHDQCKNALIADGWTITHDPLSLKIGKKDMFVDIGAEKFLAAEKLGQKVAIEIKSFVGNSEIEDLKNAIGQYVLYQNVLELTEPDRKLYLGVREPVFNELFEEPIGKLLLDKGIVNLLVFNSEREVVVKWIN